MGEYILGQAVVAHAAAEQALNPAFNQEAFLRHVLSYGDRAEILAPRPLRERARKVLAALARRVS